MRSQATRNSTLRRTAPTKGVHICPAESRNRRRCTIPTFPAPSRAETPIKRPCRLQLQASTTPVNPVNTTTSPSNSSSRPIRTCPQATFHLHRLRDHHRFVPNRHSPTTQSHTPAGRVSTPKALRRDNGAPGLSHTHRVIPGLVSTLGGSSD